LASCVSQIHFKIETPAALTEVKSGKNNAKRPTGACGHSQQGHRIAPNNGGDTHQPAQQTADADSRAKPRSLRDVRRINRHVNFLEANRLRIKF